MWELVWGSLGPVLDERCRQDTGRIMMSVPISLIFIPHITLFGLGFSNCFSGGEASKKDFLSCKVQLQCLAIVIIYHLCYCCPGACPLLCTFRL